MSAIARIHCRSGDSDATKDRLLIAVLYEGGRAVPSRDVVAILHLEFGPLYFFAAQLLGDAQLDAVLDVASVNRIEADGSLIGIACGDEIRASAHIHDQRLNRIFLGSLEGNGRGSVIA